MKKIIPKTKEEARQHAIDWQYWASEQNLSYEECSQWAEHFKRIVEKFRDLEEELKENGII